MSLDFLKNIKIDEPVIAKRTGGGGRKKDWNPIGLRLRVWKDGSIFPSQDLVTRFALEYGNKPAEKEKPTGNALDIFKGSDFQPFSGNAMPLLFVNVTPKSDLKVDVFGSTTYNEDGTPKSSVMDQGAATYGKAALIPMLQDVYGIVLDDTKPFVDLDFLGMDGVEATQSFELPNGHKVCFVPKEVARGDKKGEMTVSRRENPLFFVLYPVQSTEAELSNAAANLAEGDDQEPVDQENATAMVQAD